jgi:hypothetical protein
LLDLGFIRAPKRIVKLLPRQRQTLLFTATMPRPIAALAEDYLNDPVKVVVAPAAMTAERVEQGVVFVSSDSEAGFACDARVLVFTRTKAEPPPARRPPQPATAYVRRRDLPASGSFPAFLRRASLTKCGSVARRGEHRSRIQTRGSSTIGLRIGSD